jgi:hypothetical protein
MIKMLGVLLCILIMLGGCASSGSEQKSQDRMARILANQEKNAPQLNELFKGKIRFGMSFEEVKKILGAPLVTKSLVYKGGKEDLCTFVVPGSDKIADLHFINGELVNLLSIQ